MRIEVTETINVPVNEAFAYLANYRNDTQWKSDCVSCEFTEGDGELNTKIHYVQKMLGRKNEADSVVCEYEPNTLIAFEVLGERKAKGWRRFESSEGATTITMGLEVDVAAFLGPLASLGEKVLGKMMRNDLTIAKGILEHNTQDAS